MPYYQFSDGTCGEFDWPKNGVPGDAKRINRAEFQRLQREQACDSLRKILKPGDSVYCILRHCSRSGMRRHISLLADGMRDITWEAAQAMGEKRADDGGIKVDGCGMDMGFHLVYDLGRVLWPEGFAPSKLAIRPADEKRVDVSAFRGKGAGPLTKTEVESYIAKGWAFEWGRNGDTSGWDNDGGYALKHRWV